jgi:hypothetical protein
MQVPMIHSHGVPPGKMAVVTASGMRYVDRGDYVEPPAPPKLKRVTQLWQKHDLKHVAAARELRDRYLEHVNSGAMQLEPAGKYDVSRALPSPASHRDGDAAPVARLPELPAAA